MFERKYACDFANINWGSNSILHKFGHISCRAPVNWSKIARGFEFALGDLNLSKLDDQNIKFMPINNAKEYRKFNDAFIQLPKKKLRFHFLYI